MFRDYWLAPRSVMLGAVIGKSLGNLDHGKGVVTVLLTLQ